ncbi:nucleoside triphosphate pyrophosphohydrolase [Pseudoxanthomonas sp. LH2527]|uniref:nucleoside triphosphate pyrophosphohydrolase n=1 Tax=Pseudoxanthomonas sp. LH2527 TaxID=2923249 RepID=UPI001F136B66|nr:nucleoside triphosphate pyrophosphohydrolase [Pseudoxanthomonas sp. LH2527]MCH6485115.1 nucleoside triphosphate pyrophosphohydrolase [Pseudoxanthomonas sp. LH2527]
MPAAPDGDIARLLAIMAKLRDPDGGCPWDLEQDFSSIAPYTVEEAYEVADAIDRHDLPALKDELGDLLLQVVFHAQMASEQGAFAFGDVVDAICDKMVRRHPHVFGPSTGSGQAASFADAEAQTVNWEAIKAAERKAAGEDDTSALAGVARGLPEWQRAIKLQSRAARVGFDWPDTGPVIDKLHEEIDEVRVELAAAPSPERDARLEDEIGDLLFVAANLARHAKVDVGGALRRANLKFERRFRAMEAIATAEGTTMSALTLAQQEALWARVKQDEGGAA